MRHQRSDETQPQSVDRNPALHQAAEDTAAGISITICNPRPLSPGAAKILPRCNCTMLRHIARPRPLPLSSEPDWLKRTKRSKILVRCSALRPGPSSSTVIRQTSSDSLE